MTKPRLTIVAILSTALILGILIGINTSTTIAASTPEGAARQDLPKWLNSIRADYLTYGFKDEGELNIATLGNPNEVYLLDPLTARSYQPGQRIGSLIRAKQQWEFPVLVRGESRGILTVAYFEGRWQAVEFGGLAFGQKMIALQEHLMSAPGNVRLVKFFPSYSTFALVERGSKQSLIHLGSYVGLFPQLDRDHFTEYTPEEVMSQIKATFAEIEKTAAEAKQQADKVRNK
jgi:hypothetical protein